MSSPGRPDEAIPRLAGHLGRGAELSPDRTSAIASLPKEAIHSVALGALHAALEPLLGGDAVRRIHALGGVAHDVHDLGTIGFLVELEDAISRFGDALVAIGTRHRDPRARTVELQALERRDDFVGAGA